MKLDKQFLKACMDGDRRSQYRLYKDCFPFLISICSRYKKRKEESLEMLNTGFFKILTNLSKYNEAIPFKAWASRIMINCLIDDYRKNKKDIEIIEYQELNGNAYFFTQTDFNDAEKLYDAEEIELMILALPDRARTVFNLFAIEGFKHKEISEMLEMSINTSKWHLADARKKLQSMLQQKTANSKIVRYEK